MSLRYIYQYPQAERLLLVVLEQPQYGGSEFRHINATVVRRAVPHKMKDYSDSVETWNDDYEARCFGYRVASHVLTKTSGIFVDDLQLRGQIDTTPSLLRRNNKPYGNDIKFKPYNVCQNTARAITDFYTKYARFCDKQKVRRSDDDFYVALAHLANFLKITKVVFYKSHMRGNSLGEPENFEEYDLASAKIRIDELLLPFAHKMA